MENYQCLAAPKTTLKRCRNDSRNGTPFCNIHGKLSESKTQIKIYNGSTYTFNNNFKDIEGFTPQIFLWKELNNTICKAKTKSNIKYLENQARIIRCGVQSKIVNELIRTGMFLSYDDVFEFFKGKNQKRKTLENIRHFLGVVYYFQRKDDILRKIQINVRIKKLYGNKVDKIIKIQKWFRHLLWLKNLPVSPEVMRKHYIPNEKKIIMVQNQIKKYITMKISHSHDCPFSLEKYTEIPKKYRISYEYYEGNNKHWRYYNIKWLDSDWKSQTNEKRYVIEPVIKHEFPEEFVEKTARKIWYLTRIKNDYDIDYDKYKNYKPYQIENDWVNRFSRRSLYRFVLLMLDICNILDINIENIKNWRSNHYKLKYQTFYLQVMPALKNIASNTQIYSLEEDIFYITRDMFRAEFIFTDTDVSDIIAGDSMYGILKILLHAKQKNCEVFDIIKDIIKENIKILLMV